MQPYTEWSNCKPQLERTLPSVASLRFLALWSIFVVPVGLLFCLCLPLVTTIEMGNKVFSWSSQVKCWLKWKPRSFMISSIKPRRDFSKMQDWNESIFYFLQLHVDCHAFIVIKALARKEMARRTGKGKDKDAEGSRFNFTPDCFQFVETVKKPWIGFPLSMIWNSFSLLLSPNKIRKINASLPLSQE